MRRSAAILACLLAACAAPGPARSLTAEREALRRAATPAELRDLGWVELALGNGAAGEAALRRALDAGARDARTRLGLALRAHDTVDLAGARAGWLAILEEHDRRDPFAGAAAEAAAQRLLGLVSEPAGGRADEDRYLDRVRALWGRRERLPVEAQQHLGALLGQLLRLRGREVEAAAVDAARGCPQALWVSGPHGHLPRLDLARAFGPDDPARDPGRGAYARREVRGCELQLDGPPGRPGVIYAVSWVRAPGGAVPLSIETGGEPFALYVDGQLRYRELEPRRRRLLELDLPAGWHALSFKISLPGGRAVLQVALPGAAFHTGAPIGAGASLAAAPAVAGGPGAARTRPLSPLPPPDRLRGRGALVARAVLLAQQAYLEGDVDAGLRAVAAAEAPRLGSLRLVEAALLAEDEGRPPRIVRDRVRRALSEALEGDAALLRARIQLASLDLQDERPEPALQLLDARPAAQRGSWPALLLRYRILRSRDWLFEAEAALSEARALAPAACAPIEALLELRDALKDDRGALAAGRALVACNPYSERLAEVLRGAGELAAARAEYERLLRLQPDSEGWLASLGELRLALGDLPAGRRSFEELARRAPRTTSYHLRLANLALDEARRAGRPTGPGSAARAAAEAALRAGLRQSPASQDLHRALQALGVDPPMTPDRIDGLAVIREYAGRKGIAGAAGPRDAAVIVLDRTVVRVFPGGARWTLTHNIMQVLSKDGIDKFGEVQIPEGAEVLTLRTVKADGTTREPEEIAEKESVSAPDLEIGDFVEFEYIDRDEPPAAFPGGFISDRFYFASADAPLDRTELVLVAPADMPLQLDLRGPTPPGGAGPDPGQSAPIARTERRGDLRVLTWARRGVPRVQPEPPLADGLIAEWIPSARPASGVTLERWRDYLRDRFALGLRGNDELREIARQVDGAPRPAPGGAVPGAESPEALSRRARRLDAWVRRNIKIGGDLDEVATMALARREGNPHIVLLALLRAARIPAELWLVRPVSSPRLDGPLPPTELYSEALVAVGPPGRPILWLNPAYRHAPSGFVRPQLRGGQALRLGAIGDLDAFRDGAAAGPALATVDLLPDGGLAAGAPAGRPARRDDRRVELSMTLLADGGGEVTVRERLQGWPALEWREELERLPEDKVRKELEQRSLGFFFPGASLTGLKYGPLDDDEAPLVIEYSFSAPRLARRRAGAAGAELVLPAPYPALLSRRYVGVPRRRSPLLLSYVVPMVLEAQVQLPAGAGPVQPRPEVRLSSFGRFAQRVDSSAGRIALRAEFAMPTRRVEPAEYADFVAYARRVDSAEDAAAVIPLAKP